MTNPRPARQLGVAAEEQKPKRFETKLMCSELNHQEIQNVPFPSDHCSPSSGLPPILIHIFGEGDPLEAGQNIRSSSIPIEMEINFKVGVVL